MTIVHQAPLPMEFSTSKSTGLSSHSFFSRGSFWPRDWTQVSHVLGKFFTAWATRKAVSSVAQSCLTLCDPMDCSMPGFPVHHQQLEPIQTHIHRVSDAIQPSHPLSSPFPPAFNLSQHQGSFPMSWFFASGGQSIGVSALASVIPINIQDWFLLGLTSLTSL